MIEVFVLYYSRGDRTKAMADAVVEGVNGVEGASGKAKRADYATVSDLVNCDAAAFGSPNYFSYMAGLMKDYFDRALTVRDRTEGKPAAAFTSGGGASDTALQSLERMINSFRMVKACDGVVSSGEPSEADLEKCRVIGRTLAEATLK